MWFNTEEWKRVSLCSKLLNFSFFIGIHILWFCVYVAAYKTDINVDSIVQISGSISVAIGAKNVFVRLYHFNIFRDRLTTFTRSINEKVRQVKLTANQEQIRIWNNYYLIMVWSPWILSLLIAVFSLGLVAYSIVTHHHFLVMWLPFERPSFGLLWWLELAFQEAIIYCTVTYFAGMEAITIDCLLQLAFMYRVNNDRLVQLSAKDPQCESKLVAICRDLVDLKMYANLRFT